MKTMIDKIIGLRQGSFSLPAAITALFCLAFIDGASASIWTGAVDAKWTTAGNWQSGVAPISGESLVFAGINQLAPVNDFIANTQFNGILFPAGAGAFTLSGNDMDLGGSVVNQSITDKTINLKLRLLQTTEFIPGTLTWSGTAWNTMTIGNYAISDGGNGHGLIKTGQGTLYLRGANTYTGATEVRQGVLRLDASQSSSWPKVSASSPLAMAGDYHSAKLYILGVAGSTSQTFNGTTLKPGWSHIFMKNDIASMTVNFGTLTRQTGSFVSLVLPYGATVAASTPLYNNILGGWAVIGTDWVTHSGGALAPYATYTVPTGANPVLPDNSAAHVTIDTTSSGITSLPDTLTDIATFRIVDAANRTLNIGGGNTLRLGPYGAIWRALSANTAGTLSLNGGTLTAGGTDNSPGEIIINAGGTLDNNTSRANEGIRISSDIMDNGTGAVGITKTGPQTVVLSGANTYSGDTYVLQGRLFADSHANSAVHVCKVEHGYVKLSYGDGSSIDNGAFWLTGAQDYSNHFSIAGIGPRHTSGSITVNYGALVVTNPAARITGTVALMRDARISGINGATAHLLGKITGPGGLEVNGENQTSSTTILYNSANDWQGVTTISLSGLGGNIARLRLGASDVMPHGVGKGNVILLNNNNHAAAETRLELWGFDVTINGLISSGLTTYLIGWGVMNGLAGTTSTLTLGDNNATSTFAGQVRNDAGTLAIRKIGTGSQVFSGSCTYTGSTEVVSGTLAVSGTLTGTSLVSVTNDATFAYTGATALDRAVTLTEGGTFLHSSPSAYAGSLAFNSGYLAGTNWLGTLSGLTINTGRSIAPGASVGIAYTGNQTWSTGGAYVFEIADAASMPGTGWDILNGSGTLTLSDITEGGFTINVNSLGTTGVAGACLNFDPSETYEWKLAKFNTLSGAFSSKSFAVDTTGFDNAFTGEFRVFYRSNEVFLRYGVPSAMLILIR